MSSIRTDCELDRTKVLVVAEFNDTGGTGTYLLRLLEYLKARCSVRIVIRKDQEKSALLPSIQGMGIAVYSDYCVFPRFEHFVFRVFRRLRLQLFSLFIRDSIACFRLKKKYNPDLIFISQSAGCDYFAFLRSSIPVIIITHSLFSSSVYKNVLGRLYVKLYRCIDISNKRICTVSESACRMFKENIHQKKIEECAICIPNFGSEPRCLPCDAKGKLRILTIGHVIGYKNPFVWHEVAVSVLSRYGGTVEFVWAGDGEGFEEMSDRCRANEGISFVGFVKDVGPLYSSTDIYFQPSILESQGMAVVDAMAYSLPCVVSEAGGLVDSIEDGKEGFVCGINAIDQYVSCLCKLIENPRMRVRLGQNARRKYNKLFTKETWESKMNDVIREVAGNKKL